jgi:hypothetical protein
MNCRGRVAKTVAPDDPTVWVRTPSVYPTLSFNQDRDAPRWSLQHRMNRCHYKGKCRSIRRSWRKKQRRFGERSFSTGWSDAPSVYSVRTVVSADLQRLTDVEGNWWTDAWKKHSIGSSDATFFSGHQPTALWMPWAIYTPLHSRIWDCWIVWKCRRVQDT